MLLRKIKTTLLLVMGQESRPLLLIVLPVLLSLTDDASGQLGISLKVYPPTALRYESIIATITVANASEKNLVINAMDEDNASNLDFIVERQQYSTVRRLDRTPIVQRLFILPDEQTQLVVDLTRWYDMTELGRYFVAANIEWNGVQYKSDKTVVDVVTGIELVSVSRPVYGYPDRLRTYSLLYWTRDNKESLYLVITEDSGRRCCGFFDLGSVIRVHKPQIDVDRLGNIRVWYQCARAVFARVIVKSEPNETRFVERTLHYEDGTPYEQRQPPPQNQ